MDIKILEGVGLSNTEAKIYLALLELGSVTANKIAEKAGIHRRTVYDVVEILVEKGFVSFVIEANKKYYRAQSPGHIIEILDEKKSVFEKALPELAGLMNLAESGQDVTVYRGIKGVKNAFELMIKEKKDIFLLGSGGKFSQIFGDYYEKQWLLKVKEGGIKLRGIFGENSRKRRSDKVMNSRFISESYITPSSTSIFGDNVLIAIFGSQPLAIVIKSREVAESYKRYFDIFWKLAKH